MYTFCKLLKDKNGGKVVCNDDYKNSNRHAS